jgi:hypothetical protein
LRPWLFIAETHEEQPTAWLEDRGQRFDVTLPVLVGEDVEQAAVDHVVKHFGEVLEGQSIHDQEGGRQAPLGRLAPRSGDRLFEEVDARDLVAPAGEEEGVLVGATARIEDEAGDLVGHVEERLLRPAGVPGRLPGVGALEGGPVESLVTNAFLVAASLLVKNRTGR